MSETRFAVAVPARNEARLLPLLLQSLVVQDTGWASGHVVVVANNCNDGTADIANSFSSRLPLTVIDAEFSAGEAHVGTARKLALDTACDWIERGSGGTGTLLTTDADAIVPVDWVSANLSALANCDLVGGRLVIAHRDAGSTVLQEKLDTYWHLVRTVDAIIDPQDHDPPPRHGDHTGASLAFGCRLYRTLGGLTALQTREDVDFVTRALLTGVRLRHAPEVGVRVSTRTVGRASGGMAAEMMRRQANIGLPGDYRMPHPEDWIDLSLARRRLRGAWRNDSDLAKALVREGIDPAATSAILRECPNNIAFVERASAGLRREERQQITVDAALALFQLLKANAFDLEAVA